MERSAQVQSSHVESPPPLPPRKGRTGSNTGTPLVPSGPVQHCSSASQFLPDPQFDPRQEMTVHHQLVPGGDRRERVGALDEEGYLVAQSSHPRGNVCVYAEAYDHCGGEASRPERLLDSQKKRAAARPKVVEETLPVPPIRTTSLGRPTLSDRVNHSQGGEATLPPPEPPRPSRTVQSQSHYKADHQLKIADSDKVQDRLQTAAEFLRCNMKYSVGEYPLLSKDRELVIRTLQSVMKKFRDEGGMCDSEMRYLVDALETSKSGVLQGYFRRGTGFSVIDTHNYDPVRELRDLKSPVVEINYYNCATSRVVNNPFRGIRIEYVEPRFGLNKQIDVSADAAVILTHRKRFVR